MDEMDEMYSYYAVNVQELETMTKWLFTHSVTYYIQPDVDYDNNAIVLEVRFRWDALDVAEQIEFDDLFDTDWNAQDVDFSLLGAVK